MTQPPAAGVSENSNSNTRQFVNIFLIRVLFDRPTHRRAYSGQYSLEEYSVRIDNIKGRNRPTTSEINIYTDGSKTKLGAGSGFVILGNKKSCNIHTECQPTLISNNLSSSTDSHQRSMFTCVEQLLRTKIYQTFLRLSSTPKGNVQQHL